MLAFILFTSFDIKSPVISPMYILLVSVVANNTPPQIVVDAVILLEIKSPVIELIIVSFPDKFAPR